MTITTLKSILSGSVGSLVLGAFCSTFIAADKVLFILPVFIGFSGALTGFKLVESLNGRITNLFVFSFVMGLGQGAVTFVMVNFIDSVTAETYFLTVFDLLIYTAVSGVTSYLGAKLAAGYFNL